MPPAPERPWLSLARSLVPRLRRVSVGVRMAVRFEGRIVLVRHRFHDRARWHLPGGGVDAREDPQAAALRETEEEAGIPRARLAVRAILGTYLNRLPLWDDHVIVFVGDSSAAPGTLRLSWEIAECRAFADGELPELSPGTERRLAELRAGAVNRSGAW